MRTQTSQKAELFARALRISILGVFALLVAVSVLSICRPAFTSAATSSTLNFQARLETAGGAIVPDGNYNVEFKLYTASAVTGTPDQGACTYNGGTADPNCLWVETRTSTNQVRVVNGYLTVNLGSVNAFPGTVNWNQQLWLTMRIGGTGTPSWDAEMSPRIQLTAVPYAFQAGVLSATSGSNIGTLGFGSITGTDSITLPDASGTVCLQASSACGFATGSGVAFLQGGNSFSGTTAGELGTNNNGVLNFRTNNTDKLQLDTSGNLIFQQASTLKVLSAASGTQLTIQGGAATSGTNAGGTLILQGGAGASTGASGSVIVRANTNDSTTAFQVQNAAGAAILSVDTTNRTRVSIGTLGTATGQLYIGGLLPSSVGSVGTAAGPQYVYIQGRYAYVVDWTAGKLQVFDVSNPASPVDISSGGVATSTNPDSVYVQGRYAYVTNYGTSKLQVFDVSNPASPVDISSGGVSTGSGPETVYVQGRYAYVVDYGASKLQVFDVSNPASPTDVTSGGVATASSPGDIYVQGRYAYVVDYGASKLQVFDVSNPASPTDVTSGGVATASGPVAIRIQGRYAYVNGGTTSKLQVFDVSNPASPTDVTSGGVATASGPTGLYIQGRYAYVTAASKLQVFDVSNPASPTDVTSGGVATGTNPDAIYVQGRYAFVVNQGSNTLQVFDVGGAYIQQLEVGGAELGALSVNGNANLNGDVSVRGGLHVGQSVEVDGNLASTGSVAFRNNTNSSAAFRVQNASSANLFTVDTSNTAIVLGNDGTPTALTVRGGAATGSNIQGTNVTFDASNGTGVGGSGDFVFRTAAPATGILLDNYQSATFAGNTNTTVTWTHTPGSNSNQILVVAVVTARNQAASTVTYEGTALTKLSSQLCGNTNFTPYCEVEMWYMANPATSGTHQISVTLMPGSSVIAGGSATYYNVNTSSPFGTPVGASGTTTGNQQVTNTVTTSVGQLVIDAFANDNGAATAPSGTALWSANGNTFVYNQGSASTVTGSATAVKWNANSADWADLAVPLNPLVNSTSDTLTDRLHITAAGNVGIGTASPQYTLDVGGAVRVRPASDSSSVFQVQNASGGALFNIDTTGGAVTIGSTSATGTITVGQSTATNTVSIGSAVGAGNTQTISIGTSGTASSTTNITIGSTVAGTTTLQSIGGIKITTLGAVTANSAGVCRDTSTTILTSCDSSNTTGKPFLQGGNSFGVQGEFGTNDNFNLAFRTNGSDRLILNTSGALTFQQAGILRSLSATTGTSLTIQGGQSTGSGNNGGNLILQGGAATGGGGATTGSVIVEANGNDSTTVFQVQNAAGTSLLTADTTNSTVTVRSGNDTKTLGSELYSGNFQTVGAWTGISTTACASGNTGWNDTTATQAVHCTSTVNTTSLVNSSVAVTSGTTYQVSFSVSGTCSTTSEEVDVYIGGTLLGYLDGSNCTGDTTVFTGTASGTAGLTFTPTAGWSGTVSAISIKALSGTINPALVVQNASGTANLEMRSSSDTSNLFIGLGSGRNNLSSSIENTALGAHTLQSNDSGNGNVAVGSYALLSNTTGNFNTALGRQALENNTTGGGNVAVGETALQLNTTGSTNTALGFQSLSSNTTGHNNLGAGYGSLGSNTSGSDNIALGQNLYSNTTGSQNVAVGNAALCNNTTGSANIALGYNAGCSDFQGNFSTIDGLQNATAIGAYAQVQASNSIVLGGVDTATNVGVGITIPSNTFSVSPLDYQSGTLTRTFGSSTLTGTGTTWTSAMVGDIVIFADGTSIGTITGFTDATHVTASGTWASSTDASPVYYRFHHVGLQVASSGFTGIGTTNPGNQLEVQSTVNTTRGITVSQYSSDTSASVLIMAKARGTPGAPSAVQLNDNLSNLAFQGYNSSAFYASAAIKVQAAENWTTSAEGSQLEFYTTHTGGTSQSEAMRINGSGFVGIGTTNPQNILDVAGGMVIGASYAGTNTAPSNGLLVQGNIGVGITTANETISLNQASGNNVVGFYTNGTVQGFVGVSNSAGGVIGGSSIGDLMLRTQSHNVLISTNGGTSSQVIIDTSGNQTFQQASTISVNSSGASLTIQAGNATSGIAAGGNLLLQATTSSGGASGKVIVKEQLNGGYFQVQNSSSVVVLQVTGSQVVIGAGSGGEATPSLLVLDSETGSSSDPTEVDGAMYYNTTLAEYRCGRDGAWENCGINPIDRGFDIEDEFMGGTTTNGQIGALGWTDTAISTDCATKSYNSIAATANRPGSYHVATAATLNTGCLVSLNTADMILAAGQTMKAAFSVSSTTNEQVRIGWYAGTTQADPTTSGLWWEAVNGTANWRYCYATGAAATCANSATAVAANTFVRLEIRLTATGSGTSAATFCINGTCSTVSSVTIGTGTAVQPGYTCTDTSVATAIGCDIDYYQLRGVASSAR